VSNAIEITVNGESRQVSSGTTIAGLLRTLEIDGERVAVELNRQIIRRPDWPFTEVTEAAELEIVHFVGGG
jgi:thiamine biosynthesis protein ThiS